MYIGSDLFLPVVKQPKGIAVAEVLELGPCWGPIRRETWQQRGQGGDTHFLLPVKVVQFKPRTPNGMLLFSRIRLAKAPGQKRREVVRCSASRMKGETRNSM